MLGGRPDLASPPGMGQSPRRRLRLQFLSNWVLVQPVAKRRRSTWLCRSPSLNFPASKSRMSSSEREAVIQTVRSSNPSFCRDSVYRA